MNFCPNCGHKLEMGLIAYRERPMCKTEDGGCGFIDFGHYSLGAGGLVVREGPDGVRQALLIQRGEEPNKGGWTIPGGFVEFDETADVAVMREVEEETGIAGEIVAELGTIDFWFVADGRRIHKTVRHYLMRAVGGELSDADIEVSEVAWVPLPDIRAQLAYPDERGLVDTAGRLLADSA